MKEDNEKDITEYFHGNDNIEIGKLRKVQRKKYQKFTNVSMKLVYYIQGYADTERNYNDCVQKN